MKHLKLFEQFHADIDPYGEENWYDEEEEIRNSTPEEQKAMRVKLGDYTYNYRDIVNNNVLLVYPEEDSGVVNHPWGKVPLSIIMNPNIYRITDDYIQMI